MNESPSTFGLQELDNRNTYIIQWYDNEGTWHMDYVYEKTADKAVFQAMKDLGFGLDNIADVSKVIKKYERKVY